MRLPLLALAACAVWSAVAAAAEPFTIDLAVLSGKASKMGHVESAAPDARPAGRAVLEIKAGDKVTARWTLAAAAGGAKVEDVTVHFYAVREEKPGQSAVSKLTKGVVAESALTMDFNPGDKNEGELTFTIAAPGSYLLRVETIGAATGLEGHEDFAAVEVTAR